MAWPHQTTRTLSLYFSSKDALIDTADLVTELATKFKTRVELRQIGPRERAAMRTGLVVVDENSAVPLSCLNSIPCRCGWQETRIFRSIQTRFQARVAAYYAASNTSMMGMLKPSLKPNSQQMATGAQPAASAGLVVYTN